jgi:hypothetical protein
MTMTKAELVEMLDSYEDDQEVRLMTQQNWPFEYSISSVVASDEITESDEDDEPDASYQSPEPPRNGKPIVYLVEGRQVCYGTTSAWR